MKNPEKGNYQLPCAWNKFKKSDLPDPQKTLGAKLVVPIYFGYEKGYNWFFDLEFDNNGYSFLSPRVIVRKMFSEDVYGNECDCEECLEGREEVKNGWMPEVPKVSEVYSES